MDKKSINTTTFIVNATFIICQYVIWLYFCNVESDIKFLMTGKQTENSN